MTTILVAVVDENGNPRRGVTVAAYDLENFPAIQTTAVTDKSGVATITVTRPTFIDAFDRRGVSFRDRSYEGKIQIQFVSLGNFMNVDYVVDSNGFGTHESLFGTAGAFTQAIDDQASRVIWVCTTHTETVTTAIDVDGLANNQYVTVWSGSPYRPTIIADLNTELFSQTTANAGTNWRFIFKGIRFLANTGRTPTFFQPDAGHAATTFEVEDCFFDATGGGAWQWGLDLDGAGDANSTGIIFRKCRGSMRAFARLAAGAAATGPCIIEQNHMTLQHLFERGSSTQFEAGNAYIINDNEFTVTGTYGMFNAYCFGATAVALTFDGNKILYTGTGVFLGLGTNGSSGVFDQCVTGNSFYANAGGASFAAFNLGAGTHDIRNNVVAANSLRGPGSGTAITFNAGTYAGTGAIGTIADNFVQNGYREWATNVHSSLAVSGLGGDHGLLSGLTDDDHTQYLLASGTRNLTGNWEASTTAEGYYIQVAKLIVDDANHWLDIAENLGVTDNYPGNEAIGGTTDTVSAGEQTATQVVLAAQTRITSLSAYVDLNTLTRAFRLAVYSDNAGTPDDLLFYCDDLTATTTAAWHTSVQLRNPAGGAITHYDLAAGTYWLSIHVRGGGGFDFTLFYDAAAAGNAFIDNADTYDDGSEDPWSGGSASARAYSCYMTGAPLSTAVTWNVDSDDWLQFSRDDQEFGFYIDSTEIVSIGATTMRLFDDNFFLSFESGTTPRLTWDTGDYIEYDRTNNIMRLPGVQWYQAANGTFTYMKGGDTGAQLITYEFETTTQDTLFRIFRTTNTSGAVSYEIHKGNNTNTPIFSVRGGSLEETRLHKKLVRVPTAQAQITAVSDTLVANANLVTLTANASYTLTSTPTIADGTTNGEETTFMNIDTTDVITIQDESSLAGSNLQLGAATRALSAGGGNITLIWNSTVSAWVEKSYTAMV